MSTELQFFEVCEEGTIVNPEITDPKIRSDAFYISLDEIQTPSDLIAEVENCPALVARFAWWARERLEELEDEDTTDDRSAGVAKRKKIRQLTAVLKNEDDGWREWIRIEGQERLRRFKKDIADWLAEPINFAFEEDWIYPDITSQGNAMAFFNEEVSGDVHYELGVDIVEGEFPGSSYYAAVLRKPIDEANQVAEKLGLPFRFRRYQGR